MDLTRLREGAIYPEKHKDTNLSEGLTMRLKLNEDTTSLVLTL